MPKRKPHKRTAKHTAALLIGGLFVLAGTATTMIGSATVQQPSFRAFQHVPASGMIWDGIRPSSPGSVCGTLHELVNQAGEVLGCTHGPDPAGVGVDIGRSVEPEPAGTGGAIQCDGDGVSGNRVEAIYARATDTPDRYEQYAASFPVYAAEADAIFSESARQTGNERHIRFVTDAACNLVVNRVTLSETGDDTLSNTVAELRSQGFNRSDRKYIIWVDANVYCGIGHIWPDDSRFRENKNNFGDMFGRTDAGCWGGSVEAHELMHNLGGVQLSAPNTSGGYHCTDEYDLMCYSDASGINMQYICPTEQSSLFDCNKDDYYDTAPVAGSYLSQFWNAANNSFLIGAALLSSSDSMPPTVTISSPGNNTVVLNSPVTISGSAKDNVRVARMEIYVDGVLIHSVNSSVINTKWDPSAAAVGSHTITMKAYDAADNMGEASRTVIKVTPAL